MISIDKLNEQIAHAQSQIQELEQVRDARAVEKEKLEQS